MATYTGQFADYLKGAGSAFKLIGGPGGALTLGVNVFAAGQLYGEERRRGTDPFWAFGASALQIGVYQVFPAVMWAQMAASVLPLGIQAGFAAVERRKSWWDSLRQPNMGVYFDTSAALTMRQAAVQAIQASKLNARSVLGQEARLIADAARAAY